MGNKKKDSIKSKNRVSGRFVFLCAGFVVVLSLCAGAYQLLGDADFFPVKGLEIHSQFEKIDRATVIDVVASETGLGFYGLELEEIKLKLLAVPWIHNVAVTRRWPDQLSITVTEQQAVARWSKGGLINIYGHVFYPSKASYPKNLPLIMGQFGEQEKLLLQYREMNEILAVLNLRIAWLEQDERHAIKLGLNRGTSLLLGRKNEMLRLKRFVDVYKKSFKEKSRGMDRVDLRYSNGFAVQWTAVKNEGAADGV